MKWKRLLFVVLYVVFIYTATVIVYGVVIPPKDDYYHALSRLKNSQNKPPKIDLRELIVFSDNTTPAEKLIKHEYSYDDLYGGIEYECVRTKPGCVYSIIKLKENGYFIEMYTPEGYNSNIYGGKVLQKSFDDVVTGKTTKTRIIKKDPFSESLLISGTTTTHHTVEDGKMVVISYTYDRMADDNVVTSVNCVDDSIYSNLLPKDRDLIDSLYDRICGCNCDCCGNK